MLHKKIKMVFIDMKVCNKCSVEKEEDEFYSKRTECIVCSKEYRKLRYKQNPEIQKERNKKRILNNPDYSKTYRENNREKINSYAKYWRDINSEKSVETTLKWRNSNKEKYNEYQRLFRSNNDLIKLACNIRNRINNYLKIKNVVKKNNTFEIIGCSPEFLKEYLESQFVDGMCWENKGFYGWHIDHIIPLSFAKTEDEFYKLCHYTNLQPLWAKDNMIKSNKIIKDK